MLLMVTLEDHIQEVVVLDVLDPVCVHKLISDEIKRWTIDFEESQYCCGQVSSHDGATVKWLPVNARIVSFGGVLLYYVPDSPTRM